MNFLAIGTLIFAILSCFHENVFAYSLNNNGLIWSNKDMPIKYMINPEGFDDCEIDAIKEAFKIWGSVKNSSLRFEYGGTTNKMPTAQQMKNYTDEINLVVKEDFPDSGIAVTYIKGSDPKKTITDADILFRKNIPAWGFFVCKFANLWVNAYDFKSVALHEIGHFIGLDHPNSSLEVPSDKDRISVVQSIGPGQVIKKLYRDDEDAVQALYPSIKQILVDAPSASSSYYGMYSPDPIAASFTLTGEEYISTISVVLRTPSKTKFTTFNFSLRNSLTIPYKIFASVDIKADRGSVSTKVINVKKTLPAGTYYLVSVVPGYYGTPVTTGDVDGWMVSAGVYNNVAGTVTDGVWVSHNSNWYLSSGSRDGYIYYAPAFSVKTK